MASESIEKYLLYNAKWRVVICKACKYCPVPGKSLARHLMDEHQSIPLCTRKELITWVETLDLVEPDRVMVPDPNTLPIEGLELIEKGFKCDYDTCMNLYRGTAKSMETHCRETHKWVENVGTKWTIVALQTFFQGRNLKYHFMLYQIANCRYFPVKLPGTNIPIDDLSHMMEQCYLKDAERREQRRLNAGVIQEAHTVTLSPWLIRTRYFFTSFILNEQVARTLYWLGYGRTR